MGGPPEEQEGGSPTRQEGPPIAPRLTRRGYPGVIARSPPLSGSSCELMGTRRESWTNEEIRTETRIL